MSKARTLETAGVFVPGSLSYLPKRRYSELFSRSGSQVPDGCYDHPVLILSTDPRKKEAVVLILTSFGGKSLDEYSSLARIRAYHLPIAPARPHPDNGILLVLYQDLELPKQTYVKTETSYPVPWQSLQSDYRDHRTGKRYRLTPDSFARLLEYINAKAPLSVTKASEHQPRSLSVDDAPTRHLLACMRADNASRYYYGSVSQPFQPAPQPLPPPPVPQVPKPPRYHVLSGVGLASPSTMTTPQSVARSREGVAAATDRDLAQWRETRRLQQEARSILPTCRTPSGFAAPAANAVAVRSSWAVGPVLGRLLVVLVLVGGVVLMVVWWRCRRLEGCKW